MKRILVMGLPGAGKTTLAKRLKSELEKLGYTVAWYNADEVRRTFNDWEFSIEGRIRQSERMKILADLCDTDFVICDFVAPLKIMRDKFDPHFTIWLDTVKSSEYKDTDKVFETPVSATLVIKDKDTFKYINDTLSILLHS